MDERIRALGVGVGAGLAGIAVSYVLMVLLRLTLDLTGVDPSPIVAIGLTLVVIQGISFGGTAVAYFRYRGFSIREIGLAVPSLRQLGVGFGAFLLTFGYLYAVSYVIMQTGAKTAENRIAQIGAQHPEVLLLLIPAAYVFIGPGEELLFRGVVQGRIREAFGPVPAVVIASVIFAAIHFMALAGGASLSAKLTTLFVLLGPSLVLGATYEYTENLVVPILIHGSYDAVLFAALYVSVVYGPAGSAAVLPV